MSRYADEQMNPKPGTQNPGLKLNYEQKNFLYKQIRHAI